MITATLLSWDELPEFMRVPEVRPYWETLWRRRGYLRIKRGADIILSVVMLILLAVPMLIIAAAVKIDSPGPVLFRQVRVTAYGRKFRINKFRTMYSKENGINGSAPTTGTAVTVANDSRITRAGAVLRRYRLDEFPQLINVLLGDMSFVGTRPEVPGYVEKYEKVWLSTLLLPAGITSDCSIRFKDEDRMLLGVSDIDKVYVGTVLPAKMEWNLKSLRNFGPVDEIRTILCTALAVIAQE